MTYYLVPEAFLTWATVHPVLSVLGVAGVALVVQYLGRWVPSAAPEQDEESHARWALTHSRDVACE